jgi:hypothetical protein
MAHYWNTLKELLSLVLSGEEAISGGRLSDGK